MKANLRYSLSTAFLSFSLQNRYEYDEFAIKYYPHFGAFQKVIQTLRKLGFRVILDQSVPHSIRPMYRYGKWGLLECRLHVFPRGFDIKFYQNVNIINGNGGQYDFNRGALMPYLVHKQMELTINRLLESVNAVFKSSVTVVDRPYLATDAIVQHFQQSSFTKNKIQSVEEIESTMREYDFKFNSEDRDGKIIKCGETKYFRCGITGRLYRGIVYHNINNMWWVLINDTTYRNVAAFHLFDPRPDDYARRRFKTGQPPKSYIETQEALQNASPKALRKALKAKSLLTLNH